MLINDWGLRPFFCGIKYFEGECGFNIVTLFCDSQLRSLIKFDGVDKKFSGQTIAAN